MNLVGATIRSLDVKRFRAVRECMLNATAYSFADKLGFCEHLGFEVDYKLGDGPRRNGILKKIVGNLLTGKTPLNHDQWRRVQERFNGLDIETRKYWLHQYKLI